jgi:hypothetical protein
MAFRVIQDATINILNVGHFQPLASRDIGRIWLHACSPAQTNYGARFCLQLAANCGTTVVAAADEQHDPSSLPAGTINDFEGRVYQFSADGLNYWLINPNGGREGDAWKMRRRLAGVRADGMQNHQRRVVVERIPELKADKPLRITRSELMKRRLERQPWGGKDGEAARAITASRFLS